MKPESNYARAWEKIRDSHVSEIHRDAHLVAALNAVAYALLAVADTLRENLPLAGHS